MKLKDEMELTWRGVDNHIPRQRTASAKGLRFLMCLRNTKKFLQGETGVRGRGERQTEKRIRTSNN